jgi:hypothetical protein
LSHLLAEVPAAQAARLTPQASPSRFLIDGFNLNKEQQDAASRLLTFLKIVEKARAPPTLQPTLSPPAAAAAARRLSGRRAGGAGGAARERNAAAGEPRVGHGARGAARCAVLPPPRPPPSSFVLIGHAASLTPY